MTIKICVPEGVEVEIVRDRWMTQGMVVLSREDKYWDGWWVINKQICKFMPTPEVHKIYREAMLKAGVLFYGDEGA